MTEAKPDPKTRSSFLPIMLLVVGLVVCAGLVAWFAPLVECEACLGLRSFNFQEWKAILAPTGGCRFVPGGQWKCEWCEEAGRTTLWRRLIEKPPEDIDLRSPQVLGLESVYRILESRQSTP